MKKSYESVFLALALLVVLLSGCAPASTPLSSTSIPSSMPVTFTPEPTATTTETPIPPPTLTPMPTFVPLSMDDLASAALKAKDIPSGFSQLSGNDLQGLLPLTSIVIADFPNAQVVSFTAYQKGLTSENYDAIVVSFFFYPLSIQDIAMFDNPDLAVDTFSHGVVVLGQKVLLENENYIGNYSVSLSMSAGAGGSKIDEVVGRRNNVGFVAMVLHDEYFDKLDLATTVAQALDNNIQAILEESK